MSAVDHDDGRGDGGAAPEGAPAASAAPAPGASADAGQVQQALEVTMLRSGNKWLASQVTNIGVGS